MSCMCPSMCHCLYIAFIHKLYISWLVSFFKIPFSISECSPVFRIQTHLWATGTCVISWWMASCSTVLNSIWCMRKLVIKFPFSLFGRKTENIAENESILSNKLIATVKNLKYCICNWQFVYNYHIMRTQYLYMFTHSKFGLLSNLG